MSIPSIFLSTPLLILYGVIFLLFCIQLYYYIYFYNQIPQAQKTEDNSINTDYPSVSIILCVDNQVKDLRQNIDSIFEQDYPNFEVIIVDLASEDDTSIYLEHLEQQHANFYYSFIPPSARFISKRKLAQTIGVKASKNDWLVFTEINCRPTSNQWLKKLMQKRDDKTDIILGYNRYKREETGLNRLISYENLLFNMRFLSLALTGSPYMGVGRNLAYKKELFYQTKAFNNQLNLQRGEDDLFVNQFANEKNTRVALSTDAVVEVEPLKKMKDWRLLKKSYLLSMKRYKGGNEYTIGFETTTRLLFMLLSIALIIGGLFFGGWIISLITLFIFLIHWAIQFIIINKVAKKMGEARRYFLCIPLFNIIIPFKVFCLKFTLPRKSKGDIVALS